jgi:hypothetical protein
VGDVLVSAALALTFDLPRAAWMMLGLFALVKRAERRNWTVPKMFSETAKRYPDKAMLLFEGEKWTFRDVRCLLNQANARLP